MEIIWKNFDGDSSSDRKAKARPGRWKPVVSRADMKITPEFQAEIQEWCPKGSMRHCQIAGARERGCRGTVGSDGIPRYQKRI